MTADFQNTLFADDKFQNYKLPQPQYLGAKHNLMPWIEKFIPKTQRRF
jgi:adenine-specific DNA-methyltransferase